MDSARSPEHDDTTDPTSNAERRLPVLAGKRASLPTHFCWFDQDFCCVFAWTRTALALIGAGVAALHLLADTQVGPIAGIALVITGVFIAPPATDAG